MLNFWQYFGACMTSVKLKKRVRTPKQLLQVVLKSLNARISKYSQNCFSWPKNTQKHSKTLQNTPKHSKTLQNTPKHSRYARKSSSLTPKGTQGSLQNSKFCQKPKNPSVKAQKRLRRLFLAVTKPLEVKFQVSSLKMAPIES